MPDRFSVPTGDVDEVTALAYTDPTARSLEATLVLAHGAGADQTSPFMVSFATGLAARGVDVITFNFVYTEQGRRAPDRTPRLEACYRAVVETARASRPAVATRPLLIGARQKARPHRSGRAFYLLTRRRGTRGAPQAWVGSRFSGSMSSSEIARRTSSWPSVPWRWRSAIAA